MMNEAIKRHFGRYAGNTDESLTFTWSRLQKCESLSDFTPILKEYKEIQMGNENKFVKAYVKQAAIVSKSVDSAKFLLEHGDANLRLIDLWKAKYDPENASKDAVECMEKYSDYGQQISFGIINNNGYPVISLGYKILGIGRIPSYELIDDDNDVYTVQWLHNLVSMEYKKLLFESTNNENLRLVEASKARTGLIEAAYRYRMYEGLPLPDWEQVTGVQAEAEPTAETLPQTNDGLSYRGIAYYLICEGRTINHEKHAEILYDSLSEYSKKSTAPTRGRQLWKEYNTLQERHRFNKTQMKRFVSLINELDEMNILSPEGMEVLNNDREKIGKRL